MSRVQCLECGTAVVVDPTGVCPEGHAIGGTGVRVAGAMGSDTRHPDEPEPWVATVVLDEADAIPAVRERTIRPVRVAGADAITGSEVGEAADHESMLRELQALGDVSDSAPGSAAPRAPVSQAEAAPVPYTPPPPQEQVAEGFAELSALEAAFHALGVDDDTAPRSGHEPDPAAAPPSPAPPTPAAPTPAAPTDAASRDDLADLDDLFASQDAHSPEPSVARTHIAPAPPGAPHRPGSAETSASPPLDPPDAPGSRSAPPVAASAASAGSSTPSGSSTPTPAPDRDEVPAHTAAPLFPSNPSMAPAPPAPDTTPGASPVPADTGEEPTPANADGGRPASHVGVDITNFTAHGGKVGRGRGGRRKRFGR